MHISNTWHFWSILFATLLLFPVNQSNAQSPRETPVGRERIDLPRVPEQRPSIEKIVNAPTEGSSLADVNRNPAKDAAIRNESQEEDLEPNDFQKYLYLSTGKKFSLFGYSLFQGVPSTFAPLDRAPVTSDYVVGPGDEIVLRGWGQLEIDYRAMVDRQGNINIPKVGTVTVAGLQFRELQPYLKNAISRIYKNFELNVTLGQLRSIQIFVVGRAKRPGSYTVGSLSTLVNAIFASGGPNSRGSMRRIQLRRGQTVVVDFDFYDLLLKGDKSKDVRLLPGDVIYIPPIGRMVALSGAVNQPAIYEVGDKASLGHVIDLAGGLSPTASTTNVTLERIESGKGRYVETVALDGVGLAKAVHDGDFVEVRSISARFENAVTLKGSVAEPGRYAWTSGMRVADLVPSREALLSRSYWLRRSELKRRETQNDAERVPSEIFNVPRRKTEERSNPVGRSSAENNPPLARLEANSPSLDDLMDVDSEEGSSAAEMQKSLKRNAADINWDYALVERVDKSNLTTSLIAFNLGRAIADPAGVDNIALLAGDIITIFSHNDLVVASGKRNVFVRLEGEFNAAGLYQARPGETLRQLIERAGGMTPEAYLYAAEFARESAQRSQQQNWEKFLTQSERDIEYSASKSAQNVISPEEALALKEKAESNRRLLQKLKQVQSTGRVVFDVRAGATPDSIPEVVLEDGDRFTVPARPAFVNVVGAVYDNNSFIHQPGKSVSDYVRIAGGGTRDADTRNMFVIQANGAVVRNKQAAGWFTGGFGSRAIQPGDTIVIPDKLNNTSLLKGLKDWSQVFSQFALGAAAIQVFTRN